MKKLQMSVMLRPALIERINKIHQETGHTKSVILAESVERGINQAETMLRKRGEK